MEKSIVREDNILYVTRDIYEECKKKKLEFESTPKIINDRNYYSIPEEILNQIGERKKLERIIAYRDGITNQIYLPEKYHIEMSSNKRTILNKKCYITTIRQLEQIVNKEIIIATVFLTEEEKKEIIICKTGGHYFMKDDEFQSFELNHDNRKRIKVDGVLFTEISMEEINLLNIISDKEGHNIHFIIREIIPKTR